MTKHNKLLNQVQDNLLKSEAVQKTYKGKKRSELKDSDFLFPETRSFPIVSPSDIPDAISNFGRMGGKMTYEDFLKKLYNMAKRKGPKFVEALPEATKEKLGIKKVKAECDPEDSPIECEKEKIEDQLELEMLKKKLKENGETDVYKEEPLKDSEEEEEEEDMNEYRQDFYEMSVGSIKSIMVHAYKILEALDNPSVKNNLTESWLQGKIAVTEDYMITIHNFVMFGPSETDTEGSEKKLKIKDLPHYTYVKKNNPGVTTPESFGKTTRPGLWENIRKKKERKGKKYRPAKPGDKDRPDPEQWKKLTK